MKSGAWSVLGLILALGFLRLGAAEIADPTPVAIDALLKAVIDRSGIAGMSAVVLRGDRIIAQGVAGVRKQGTGEAITRDDQFELSSCTKAMTATLVAMLVEDGKLSWDTTLAEIFADTGGRIDPAWKAVTVRQVLDQRSGLTGNHPFAFWASVDRRASDLPKQRQTFVLKLLTQAPDGPPGQFVYTAANFIVAGAMLEKLTGGAWEDLVRARLYAPLGLTSGGFGPPGVTGQVTQPWGHGYRRLSFVPLPGGGNVPFDPGATGADYPPAAGPAGMAHMSVSDWAKFVAVYLRANPANPNRQVTLLKADTFARMHEPGEHDYAAGWFIGTRPWAKGPRPGDTGRVFYHAGDNGRWSTAVWAAPEIDFAILIACNRGGMEGPVDEVAGALLQFIPKAE